MSAANCFLSEDQLLCGICLDVFTDPVTLPCGHNFCQKCIKQHWDSNSKCECPTCKYPFYKELDLRVNNFISEMAAQFSRSRSDSSDQQLAKPGEVPCDICTETKWKAVKPCLVCLASYCDNHLQSHLTVPCLKRHQLTDPVENLEGRMCKIHEKPLELFCKTDQICVCMLGPVLDHKSHEVIPLKEQFERKKADLEKTEAKIHQKIQERRLKIEEFKNLANVNKESGDREKADGVQVFHALIQSLEISKAELIEEISELIRKRAEVEQLSRSKDYVHVLQSFASLKASALTKDWTEVSIDPPSYEGTLRNTLDQLDETLGKVMEKALQIAELNRVQKCAVDMVFDPDSAHHALMISADGKQVHHAFVNKKLSNTPKRFNPSCCVLGREGFSSGKFYFETVVREKTRWTVGVSKESIKRKGIIPLSPENGHWTIWLKNGDEYAALVGSPLKLSLDSKPQKVGVFVDYDEGLVSFYNVDTADLLYSFAGCSFTEKIYPFFSPGLNDDGINSVPLTLSSVGH